AHHAIIPSEKSPSSCTLSHVEIKVYQLIAKQYLAQFYAAWHFQDSRADFTIAGGLFVAKERLTLDKGWKFVFEKEQADSVNTSESAVFNSIYKAHEQGENYLCETGELLSQMSQAPQHFSHATLLAAMPVIARFVRVPRILRILT